MFALLLTAALAASPTESPTPSPSATATPTAAAPETATAITLSPQKSELNQPEANKSLIEISAKLNAQLPETEKIIIPSPGSRQFFSQLAVFTKSTNSAQTAKNFLKLSDLFLQGCNAYSASGLTSPIMTGAIESFDITNAQVRRKGSLKDAQNLARISLTTAQCKGPIIVNSIGMKWLEQSLETLKTMNLRRLKKDDKMRLKALQEQVLGLDSKEILEETMRFEVLISSAEIMKTMSEVPPAHAESPEDVFNNALLLNEEGKPHQISIEKSAELTMKLLQAVHSSKTYQFPEYIAEIDRQIKEGRDGIVKDLDLKNEGFTSYEKFQDEAFMESFAKRLIAEPDLLKRVKRNLSKSPDVATHLFQNHLAIYKVSPKFFEAFNERLLETQKKAKNLIK
ncbi:hypothetical protein ACLVWU_01020 [Bdellovibrio sp. HCB290]|uniref:hypothetical protein n=1 Tax=Bdellovibrio sp. HCB290 TaxID=3394356 RepID=UPI0039B47B8F